MAISWNSFDKIWASTSPLTPYEFSDPNYSQGWNFVGSTPPARQMWDSIQKTNDEKFKYLRDNFGTPNIVTQASQMTDTDKVYVYLGSEAGWNSGHWYYYDEGTSSWADGGVYNSVAFVTDTTLSIAGQPADAKATGDALALKSDLAGCTFTGNVSVNADLSVTGDATIGTDLSVTGVSTLTGNVSAGADVTVVGDVSSANLTTSADATIGGDLSVTGTSTLAGNITTSGDISADNISATTNGTVGGNLSVTGTSTLTGNINAGADITAVGDVSADNLTTTTNATVGGSLLVAGTSTLTGNVTTNGNISAVGDISSANLTTTNATIGGNATVTGDVSCANLTTSADASVGGDLTVTGDSTLADTTVNNLVVNNDLSVAGDSSLTNLSVSGTTALAGTSTAPTPSADDNSTNIATTEYVQTELKPIEVNADIVNKRVTNIEKLLQGNLYDYQTDSTSAYTKTVPQGAMPYASLNEVGGKTVVWNQLRRSDNVNNTSDGITTSYNATTGLVTITNDSRTANFSSGSNQVTLMVNSTIPSGHKFTITTDATDNGIRMMLFPNTTSYNLNTIITALDTYTGGYLRVTNAYDFVNTHPIGDVYSFHVNIVDLTLMYGSGNEPATYNDFVATFPAFVNTNISHDSGQLLSAGVTEVKSVGKNRINVGMPYYSGNGLYNQGVGVHFASGLNPNVNIQKVNDSEYTMSVASMWQGLLLVVPLKSGESVHLSGTISSTVTNTIRGTQYYLDAQYNVIQVIANISSPTDTVTHDVTRTAPSNCAYFATSYLVTNTSSVVTFRNMQIEYGTTATTYSPYQENTYPIPASIQALDGYGWSAGSVYNYIDYERKVFVKNVVSATYNGTEDWGKQTDINNPYYYLKVGNNGDVVDHKVVCDSFETVTIAGTNTNVGIDIINSSGYNAARILIRRADMSGSKDDFKTWLASNNITVNYALSTPQEIDISEYLTDDNLISVESGGTLTFPNSNGDDYRIDVPSAETYMVDLQASL